MKAKNLLLTVVFFTTLSLTFYGCKKDESRMILGGGAGPNATSTSGASMRAMVDGVTWVSLSNRAAGAIISNTSNLTGVASDSTVITITITESVVLNGTYDLGPASNNVGVFSPSTSGVDPAWSSNSNPDCFGELKITAMDPVNKVFSGTFSFKAWRFIDNSFKEITSGVFNKVPYVTSMTGGGSNTFTIKIDGVTFTPAVVVGQQSSGNIYLTASDSQGSQSVGVVMPDNITPGTYSLMGFGTYSAQYNPDEYTFTIATYGNLTISSHNTTSKHVVGTIEFVSESLFGGPPTYNLTQGAFSFNY